MPTAFRQHHNRRHAPLASLAEQSLDDVAAALSVKVCRNARAHSADTVVFVAPDLSVSAIVETSSVCAQAETHRPHQIVGRWRRADPVTLRRAIEAYLSRVGIQL